MKLLIKGVVVYVEADIIYIDFKSGGNIIERSMTIRLLKEHNINEVKCGDEIGIYKENNKYTIKNHGSILVSPDSERMEELEILFNKVMTK